MSRDNRVKLISEIERIRRSKVICYITGDRQGLETRIGMDVFPLFYDLLSRVGSAEQLDLFLYSTGGITMAGWGLVNVLREFCKKLTVLIPFKAYSTATLIALGADEIIMGKLGQLSPVDPSVQSPFNPQLKDQFLPVSVEDVVGFLDLARKEANLSGEESSRVVFEKLATDVRPMALGNVYRVREQIGMLARKLLRAQIKDDEKKDSIVSIFTRERYSHDYLISRQEAREEIGLNILNPVPDDLESKMMDLYTEYANVLELHAPYSPDTLLGQDNEKVASFKRAFVETRDRAYVFATKRHVKRVIVAQGVPAPVEGFQQRTLSECWEPETEGG
jgi:hypothetical protein